MSASLVGVVRGLFAIGRVDVDESSVAFFSINRGFESVTRTGIGVYVLVLQEGLAIVDVTDADAAGVCLVQAYGATSVRANCSQTNTQFLANQIQVNLFTDGGEAPAAVDVPFAIQVQDVNPQ